MTDEKQKIIDSLKRYTEQLDLPKERGKPRLLALLFTDFNNKTHDEKINLLGIFDRVFVHPEMKRTPPFTIFVRTAETTEEPVNLTLFTPGNKPAVSLGFGGTEMKYTEGMPAQLQLVSSISFELKGEGVYWFDISYKGESLGGAGLSVEYRETEDKSSGTDTYI